MGKLQSAIVALQQRADGFFYKCEYIKQCTKVTRQCTSGGNSYCGEYKKRINR